MYSCVGTGCSQSESGFSEFWRFRSIADCTAPAGPGIEGGESECGGGGGGIMETDLLGIGGEEEVRVLRLQGRRKEERSESSRSSDSHGHGDSIFSLNFLLGREMV